MSLIDRALMQANAGERLAMLLTSYTRLTGLSLGKDEESLWANPHVVLAHDTASPPRFFYGNKAALDLFRYPARTFIGTPSQESAEPVERAERAEMFARLEADDLVTDYGGIRIASDGSRFRIENAVIWNIRDSAGVLRGQAATFAQWEPLPG